MSGWDDPIPASGGGNGGWGAPAAAPVVDTGAWKAEISAPIDEGVTSGGGGGDFAGDDYGANRDTNHGTGIHMTCRICSKEGHFSKDCPDKPDNFGACFNCGEQGHSKSECPTAGVPQGPCRHCEKEGHFSRECPDKPANFGACFNCGEQGHNKSECPNPRVPQGPCRHCQKEGHFARECPEKPAEMCRNCTQEGHYTAECTNPRKLDLSHIVDRSQEEAWDLMTKANDTKDFDSFKQHMLEYLKASPGTKLDEIEKAMRTQGFNYWIYALEREPAYNEVIVGPSGELDCKYVWTLNTAARPRRSRAIAHRMAGTPEENMKRLKFAGEIMPETKPFCHTCKAKGHSGKRCEVERPEDEIARVVLKCSNCDALDHRRRDCPEPRKVEANRNACRNCGEEGHRASDCTVPRQADENTECRKCGKLGHFSKECPERGAGGSSECYNCGEEGHRSSDCTNERVPKCRNCDERGHVGKDCPKPRDITRVKCNNCGEMGHFSKGCTNPALVADNGEAGISFPAAEGSPSEAVAGAWGGAAKDTSFAETIGGWTTSVEPVGGGGGGW